jgi:sugar/nucleoside kinase (ribokinase family)
MNHFLCIGDTMLDVSVVIDSEIHEGGDTQASISTHGGGAAANVATWLAYSGNDVFLCSRSGDDVNGEFLHDELDRYGVRHAEKRAAGEKTGVVVILVGENGERTMFPDSGANSGLSIADLPPLGDYTAVYLSGYALINPKSRKNVSEMMKTISAAGKPIVLDPGTVGALRNIPLSMLHEWISMADILILNEEEAIYASGERDLEGALVALANLTPLVVVKRGKKGAIAIFEKVMIVEVPTEEVEVLDTTGAGDSFVAAFMSAWFDEPNLELAIQAGILQATTCIASVGARPPLDGLK